MTEIKMRKFQASPLTRYGEAGPPVQHSDKITISEIKKLIEENKIRPDQMFSKEQILDDPKVKEHIEIILLNEQIETKIKADKLEENSMIPGDDKPILTPGEKKQQEEDNEFIPDDDKPGDSDNDLIPD